MDDPSTIAMTTIKLRFAATIKRFCWLFAWGVWIWLGVGLYRELPRDLGPLVCRIPFQDDSTYQGFLENKQVLITKDVQEGEEPDLIRLWNVQSGELMRSIELPAEGDGGIEVFSPTNAFIVTERRRKADDPQSSGLLSALDLGTGRWTDLPEDAKHQVVFHDHKPWAACWDFGGEGDNGTAFVVHLQSGVELFRWNGKGAMKPDRELNEQPFFVGDLLAVPTRPVFAENRSFDPSACALELWSIPPGAEPQRIIQGLNIGDDATASPTGRIAWHTIGVIPFSVDVFDIHVGDFVFSHPPHAARKQVAASGGWRGPWLSRDGRHVYGMEGKLWDIESGVEVWPKCEGATLVGSDDYGRIEVQEEWALPYAKNWTMRTYAVRDIDTKRLIYRSWKSSIRSQSSDGLLMVDSPVYTSGEMTTLTIHKMPFRVNYPLFALCQTVLALPLVLLWAVLRFRRRQAARRLGALQP